MNIILKDSFKKWLTEPKGGDITILTRKNYMNTIDDFQKLFLHGKDFYSCSIEYIETVIADNKTAVDAFNAKRAGAFQAAKNKYKKFLEAAPAFAPASLRQTSENIDITDYVTPNLLINLFRKTFKVHFPGYDFYKAQAKNCKDFSFVLENPTEKKALFVVLLPHSTNERPKLLVEIISDFDILRGLLKEKDFSVVVMAGSFEDDFITACKLIPSIKLMRYSINAFELQDIK